MPTQCSQEELDFGSSGGRKLVGAFDGGAITSNGGALLLGAADRSLLCIRACLPSLRLAYNCVGRATRGRSRRSPTPMVATFSHQAMNGVGSGHDGVTDRSQTARTLDDQQDRLTECLAQLLKGPYIPA
jgi:hypothetical protein